MYYERKNRATARAEHAMELCAASEQRTRDLLEYVAMMADVDLPEEDVTEEAEEDEQKV